MISHNYGSVLVLDTFKVCTKITQYQVVSEECMAANHCKRFALTLSDPPLTHFCLFLRGVGAL